MKTSRIACVLVSGFILFVLLEQAAVADAGVGWVLPAAGGTGLFLVVYPMLVEMFFLRKIVAITLKKALVAAFLMNLCSTVAGFLLLLIFTVLLDHLFAAFLILGLLAIIPAILHALSIASSKLLIISLISTIVGIAGLYATVRYNPMEMTSGRETLLNLSHYLSVIVFGYGLSLAIEVWPARRYIPSAQLDSAVVTVNIYSYIVFFVLWSAMLIGRLPLIL
jgi:hypothetical protein